MFRLAQRRKGYNVMTYRWFERYLGRGGTRKRTDFTAGRRSAVLASVCLLVMFLAFGCTSTGTFPQTSGTQVDLSRKNFRVVKANAVGSSSGFKLFCFIPFSAPSYTEAMSHLYRQAGVTEGAAQTLTNVTQERSSLYLLLFSIPKLTIRADIIEFTE